MFFFFDKAPWYSTLNYVAASVFLILSCCGFAVIHLERIRNSETINIQMRNLSYGKTSRIKVRTEEVSESLVPIEFHLLLKDWGIGRRNTDKYITLRV